MAQRSIGADGAPLRGYRYRLGGRDATRVQKDGYLSEHDAREALERALERVRRSNGTGRSPTLAELVGEYLAQHDAQPETVEKLRCPLFAVGVAKGLITRLSLLRSGLQVLIVGSVSAGVGYAIGHLVTTLAS